MPNRVTLISEPFIEAVALVEATESIKLLPIFQPLVRPNIGPNNRKGLSYCILILTV